MNIVYDNYWTSTPFVKVVRDVCEQIEGVCLCESSLNPVQKNAFLCIDVPGEKAASSISFEIDALNGYLTIDSSAENLGGGYASRRRYVKLEGLSFEDGIAIMKSMRQDVMRMSFKDMKLRDWFGFTLEGFDRSRVHEAKPFSWENDKDYNVSECFEVFDRIDEKPKFWNEAEIVYAEV